MSKSLGKAVKSNQEATKNFTGGRSQIEHGLVAENFQYKKTPKPLGTTAHSVLMEKRNEFCITRFFMQPLLPVVFLQQLILMTITWKQ